MLQKFYVDDVSILSFIMHDIMNILKQYFYCFDHKYDFEYFCSKEMTCYRHLTFQFYVFIHFVMSC